MSRRPAMGIAATLVAGYLLLCAALYLGQRALQYFPGGDPGPPSAYGVAGFDVVRHRADDGVELVSWYRAPATGHPVILYLQGNAQTIAERAERFRLFADDGFGVFALGYRGYGASEGAPSEAGLTRDARSALAWLAKLSIGPERIILFGESLGSGIAVPLAAGNAAFAGMILDSPFTSAADVARSRYWFVPVGLLMKDQYRSLAIAGQVTVPTLVFHGDRDGVVPFSHGERLHGALAGRKLFVPLAGEGHVAPMTPALWGKIKAFLAE